MHKHAKNSDSIIRKLFASLLTGSDYREKSHEGTTLLKGWFPRVRFKGQPGQHHSLQVSKSPTRQLYSSRRSSGLYLSDLFTYVFTHPLIPPVPPPHRGPSRPNVWSRTACMAFISPALQSQVIGTAAAALIWDTHHSLRFVF